MPKTIEKTIVLSPSRRVAQVDYFSEVTLFRRNHHLVPLSGEAARGMAWWRARTKRGQYLLCYDCGKSVVRLVDGASPSSVHAWTLPRDSGFSRRTALADARMLDVAAVASDAATMPCVLHYVACGSFWLRTKYDRPRGRVADWSRRRRGRDADIPRRRVAATPRLRRGYSVETSRGDAAAVTWIVRGVRASHVQVPPQVRYADPRAPRALQPHAQRRGCRAQSGGKSRLCESNGHRVHRDAAGHRHAAELASQSRLDAVRRHVPLAPLSAKSNCVYAV